MASFADLALGLNPAVAIDRCFQTMVHSLRHRRRHFVLEIFPCGHRVPKWIVSELVTGREGKGSSAKEGRSASRLTLDEVKSPFASLVAVPKTSTLTNTMQVFTNAQMLINGSWSRSGGGGAPNGSGLSRSDADDDFPCLSVFVMVHHGRGHSGCFRGGVGSRVGSG